MRQATIKIMSASGEIPDNFQVIREIISSTAVRENGFDKSLELPDWVNIPDYVKTRLHEPMSQLKPKAFQAHLNNANLGLVEESGDLMMHLILHKALTEELITEEDINWLRSEAEKLRQKLARNLAKRMVEAVAANVDTWYNPDIDLIKSYEEFIPATKTRDRDSIKKLIKALWFRAALINTGSKNTTKGLRDKKIPEEFLEYFERLGNKAKAVESALMKLLSPAEKELVEKEVKKGKPTDKVRWKRLIKILVDKGLHKKIMEIVLEHSKEAFDTTAKKGKFTMANILDFAADKARSYRAYRVFSEAMGHKKSKAQKGSKAWEAIWEAARFFKGVSSQS